MTQLIVPDAFNFVQSVTILAMVVIGGIGSTWGAVIGAIILTLMPEAFRFINDYKLLVYGALLLLVMRFAPRGLAGIASSVVTRFRK
jgi:branched-chain amino acid transport system permease protein